MGPGMEMKEESKLKGRASYGPVKCYELKRRIDSILCRQRLGKKVKIDRGTKSEKKTTHGMPTEDFLLPKSFK